MTSQAQSPDAPRPDPVVVRAIDRASSWAAAIAGVALVALLLNVAADVIARTVGGRPLGRTLEMTTFWWMPVLIALSFAVTERQREHITVTLLLDRLDDRLRGYVEGTFTAIATLLVVLLAWFATQDAISAFEVRLAANSTPPLSYWAVKILMAAGLTLLALQLAATTYRHFTHRTTFTDDLATEADAL